MKHPSVKQDITYAKHVYIHSKLYVGSVVLFQGGR